jgi:LuxR family maltose regulon positive regulatory protein
MSSVIEILVLKGLAHQLQGSLTPALTPLERALTLAEPEGFLRIFVDEGKPAAESLTRMDVKDGTPRIREFNHQLLFAFDVHNELHPFSSLPGKINGSSASSQRLIEPLSKRELEVLRLLRTNLNAPEIARECFVSLSTIRTHTKNIFIKLGINDRRAAIRPAEDLDFF